MNRLRNRLILVFLAATLVPLALTFWMTTFLLQQSLSYVSTRELDGVSKSLEQTAREYYRQAREGLKNDLAAGRVPPRELAPPFSAAVLEFFESGEPERFLLSGEEGNEIQLLERHASGIRLYSRQLGGPGMNRIASQYAAAREILDRGRTRDLRRGLTYTYILVAAGIWMGGLIMLVYLAHRVSRPIHDLTAGLRKVSGGDLEARVERAGDGKLAVEVHDSGPGLPPEARETLFEPTLSFKKGGMGLGLSIARRSALLSGGDIVLMEGELGGAAFRVTLPPA